jgi:Uma2 family endonuclease
MPDTHAHWTVDALRELPDDGRRYEVVDGLLLVSPSPSAPHQRAVGELYVLLHAYLSGRGMEVFVAPAAITWSHDTEVQPDLLALRLTDGRPVQRFEDVQQLALAVEVLSPSTMRADRYIKRRKYQERRVEAYWIVDVAGRYVECWRPNDEEPDLLLETLKWQPLADVAPLTIDLVKFFQVVHGT